MKKGTVLLIGRPNVGKSTFVNNVIGQKVAITSKKPQTTRFPIHARYQDERGEIIFVDTPGIFDRTKDALARKINVRTEQAVNDSIDVVLYMVDHTRKRDFEEGKVLGMVRKMSKPKILVINKVDLQEKTFLPQYEFLKDEFPYVFQISSINKTHVKPLMAKLFELLPEAKKGETLSDPSVFPALNIDSKTYLAELIREKIFLKTGQELPYTTTVVIDEVTERSDTLTYIKARILTNNARYKKMLIGRKGEKIKLLGSMARKEIELATGKKIFLDLTVETDSHWQHTLH